MYQKLVYQCQNWPILCIWRDLYMPHLCKVFLAKCSPKVTDLYARAQFENAYY